MLIHNYTLHDLVSISLIIPVFAIFLFAPGYALGWAVNLLGFRRSSPTEQVLLSLPISLVLSVMMANLLGRYAGHSIVMGLFLASAVATVALLIRQWSAGRKKAARGIPGTTKIAIALAVLWTLVVIASLVDIQIGHRLYINTAVWDQCVRVGFIDAALRSGPPPKNPFSYLGSAPTARYYYFWYVLCSYPARLTRIGARCVLYGSSVWAGFSLAALIPLYLKRFAGVTENLRRRSLIGILLLSITGLDILPTIYLWYHSQVIHPDMEWWDPAQVTAWIDALLWVPHHVAALVACLAGLLALWQVRDARRFSLRFVAGTFAALAFAASAGLSVYVTFTFGLFLICWNVRLFLQRRLGQALTFFYAGLLTVALSIPYLKDLHSPGANGGGFLTFGVRDMAHTFTRGQFPYTIATIPVAIVITYAIEFGFFGLVGLSRFKKDFRNRGKLAEADVACWYLLGTCMFAITFLHSSVIGTNDFAIRSAMIAQFVLLLWGASYLDDWMSARTTRAAASRRIKSSVILATLILGFTGTTYGLCILRTYTMLDDKGWVKNWPADWLPQPPRVGADLFDTRQAYQQLSELLGPSAIVQYNPMTPDYMPLLQYSRFQSVDAFPDCGTEFGGDVSRCAPAQDAIDRIFNKPGDYDVRALCGQLSIDALVARRSDPAWHDANSWVWMNRPIVANDFIRVIRCR